MPLLFLIIIFFFLIVFFQLGIFSLVLTKLGLSPNSALLLLSSTLLGSFINLPLFSLNVIQQEQPSNVPQTRLLFSQIKPVFGKTIIALNVGGALIPVCFSAYLIYNSSLTLLQTIFAIGIVSLIGYIFSRPIKGLGIAIPVFIAPVTAALCSLLISPEFSAPLAYICGTLGVLIGADIFRLKDIRKIGTPVASIGGAGTFDGIFLTGIIAVLLT